MIHDASIIHFVNTLKAIDHDLENMYYTESRTVIGRLSGEIIHLPPIKQYKYSAAEFQRLHDRKILVIKALHNLGVIDDEGYKQFILSDDVHFTPNLNL